MESTPRQLILDWIREHQSEYPDPEVHGRTHALVRAAATYAIAHEIPAAACWSALTAIGHGVPVRHRRAIWSTSQRYVAETTADSAPAAARLALARRLVGRVLSPVDPSIIQPGSSGQMRRAFAVIVLDQMASGYEAVHVSPEKLAVRLGASTRGTVATIQRLVRAGWIRHVRTIRGNMRLYKVCRLDARAGAVADTNAETVDSLALGEETTNLARVLRSADHVAWGYAAPSPRAWIVAVTDAAGLRGRGVATYAASIGARAQRGMPAMRAFAAGDLEVHAVRAGAYEARAERERELEELWVADREKRAQMTAEATARREARQFLNHFCGRLGTDSQAGITSWLAGIRFALAEHPQPSALLPVIAELVASDLAEAGMDAERAAEGGRRATVVWAIAEARRS